KNEESKRPKCKLIIRYCSRNSPTTRRFTFWYSSSPSCTILQHRRTLGHWATWYCFTELLGNTPTALFFRRLDPFLHGSAHWNKR
ncbi:hypothetical protein MTR67_002565, partial [Solanum verrucosum]